MTGKKTTLRMIIVELSRSAGLTIPETAEAVEALLEAMRSSLRRGERIEIRGLGAFRVRTRRERWARDIRRNKKVFVPSHASAVFQAGLKLKKQINERGPDGNTEPAG